MIVGKLLCWLLAVDLETMDHEERFGMLEDGMRRLMIHLGLDNQNDRPQNPNPRPYDDRNIKIDIPDFDGLKHKDNQRNTARPTIQVAKVKMTKVASTWLQGIQRMRLREGRN